MRSMIFPVRVSKVLRLPRKSGQVIRSAAPVTQNHLSKPEDLMLQNATPLRKSAPWPLNISDEHVSCTALATQNASLQILFKCPTLASAFETFTKPSRCAHFLIRCRTPCACHAVWHLNVQKWSEHVALTFWLENALRATVACTFSSSQLPKVLREWCVLYILTWKCASRHNSVHFFIISTSKSGTSKSGLRPSVFYTFDLERCFPPQWRALFRHLNFQKCSENGVLSTFWLRNVLCATTACNFSSLIWPDGSAPAALASLLFDPPEPQIIVKYSESRHCYLFAHLHLLSSDSFSSLIFVLLLFSSLTLPTSAFPFVHIVGSLTSKLPSIIYPSH